MLAVVVCGILALLATPGVAFAATHTVTTTTDSDHGACTVSLCSLRDAIKYSGSGDQVSVPAGTYMLTLGELGVSHSLTINGAGAGSTIISANGNSRVFNVSSLVSISALTVTAGKIAGGNYQGGGIYNTGNLTLSDVVVTSNKAESASGGIPEGGGIFNAAGQLTLTSSQVTGNWALTDGGGGIPEGGGIANETGQVAITGSQVTGNLTEIATGGGGIPFGGGIFNNTGTVQVTGSSINSNTAEILGGDGGIPEGGGIGSNGGSFTVSASTVNGNTAASGDASIPEGGGIETGCAASSSFAITNSTVSGNTASAGKSSDPEGGGIAAYCSNSSVTITSSTVSGNTATAAGGSADEGGGIFTTTPSMSIVNSTISGNRATTTGAGSSTAGGGILQAGTAGVSLTLLNATLASNSADSGTGGNLDATSSTTTFKNTIVSGGIATTGLNCAASGGTITSQGHNLDSRNDCGFNSAGDLRNADPKLGALTDNGGPTQTSALLVGSPAIDTGANSGCPSTDQRGVSRPQGAACDIGAYEFAPPTVSTGPVSGITTSTASLSGLVTPNLRDATWHFVYGTTASYGSATAVQDAGAGNSPVAVGGALSGLTPGTTYHYRLVATNADGTNASADQTFTTALPPPVLSGLKMTPARFFAAPSGPSIARVHGTTVTYHDSEAAITSFAVLQTKPGVRRGRACVAPPQRKPKHTLRRCKRTVVLGRFSRRDVAGDNRFHFSGRIGGRALKPAAYTLRAIATLGSLTSNSAQAKFRIKKSRAA